MSRAKLELTMDEQEHVRVALLAYCARTGTREVVASLVGVHAATLTAVLTRKAPVTAAMTFRVARLLEASIDELIAGRYHPPGPCPYCGRCG